MVLGHLIEGVTLKERGTSLPWSALVPSLFLIAALASISAARYAQAIEFEYQWSPPIPADCNQVEGNRFGQSGILRQLTARFDDLSNHFTWSANFLPCDGFLPDGYQLIVSEGPNPKNHPGEYVAIFFDRSTDPTRPIVNVFGYRGNSDSHRVGDSDGSNFFPPDRIRSNHPLTGDDGAGWLIAATSTDHPDGSRTLHLELDTTVFRSHVPAYTRPNTPWQGLWFTDRIGFWFTPKTVTPANGGFQYCSQGLPQHPCAGAVPGQSSEGYLANTFPVQCTTQGCGACTRPDGLCFRGGFYDDGMQWTNRVPQCALQGIDQALAFDQLRGCYVLPQDGTISGQIVGTDTRSNGTPESLTVSYTESIPGANVSPPNGTTALSPLVVDFSYTARLSEANSRRALKATFVDLEQAVARCEVPVCVKDNTEPLCSISLAAGEESICEGALTSIQVTGAGSVDADGDLLSFSWSTTCVDAIGQPSVITIGGGGASARLDFEQPGNGEPVSCEVNLTVSDGSQDVQCSLAVNVPACELDCLGQFPPNAQVDECGVCNGTNACFDCTGVAYGVAEIDRCGQCEGDGTTCLGCSEQDITPLLYQLDGNGGAHAALLIKAARLLSKHDRSRAGQKKVFATIARAKQLRALNWALSWELPQIVQQCSNTQFCVSSSNSGVVERYLENSREFQLLLNETLRRARKSAGRARLGRTLLQQSLERSREAESLAEQVPTSVSSCSQVEAA